MSVNTISSSAFGCDSSYGIVWLPRKSFYEWNHTKRSMSVCVCGGHGPSRLPDLPPSADWEAWISVQFLEKGYYPAPAFVLAFMYVLQQRVPNPWLTCSVFCIPEQLSLSVRTTSDIRDSIFLIVLIHVGLLYIELNGILCNLFAHT